MWASNSSKTGTTDTEQEEMYDEVPDNAEGKMGMSHEEYLETYKDESYTIKDVETYTHSNIHLALNYLKR